MLDALTATCENPACDRPLDEDRLIVAMQLDGGERRAYECTCGAVTVTVARSERER